MKLEAVLFDLDGTLVDSLGDLADSMNTVLARNGLPTHPTDAYRYFVGEGIEVLVQRALPGGLRGEPALPKFVGEMQAEYEARWADSTRPYPGIPELLGALAGNGIPIAVLSNKPHEATCQVVSRLLGSWSFSAVLGAGPGLPKKPDPSGALRIARDLGIAPASWLYLGDTAIDMATANAAGMFAVGALWGFRDRRELLESGAKILARHPLDVLTHLAMPERGSASEEGPAKES